MHTDPDFDRTISSWLEADAPRQLPDRVLRATFDRTRRTRQQAGWRAVFGTLQKDRPIYNMGASAAMVLAAIVAIVGMNLLSNRAGDVGGHRSPSLTASPASSPSPVPAGTLPPEGTLPPGRYIVHPLPTPHEALALTYTVPDGWQAAEGSGLMPAGEPTTLAPDGVGIQFIDVTTLNDPCNWSGAADDVTVGPGADDLVEALRRQTAYEVAEPIDVTIGGYRGKRVDIVMPVDLFAGQSATAFTCDSERFRPWSTTAHGENPVYAQGPGNRWQTNVLDVEGTRLVIVVQDFPATSPADRAELDAIVASIAIDP